MKKIEKPTADVGVIVGRFQVHELHEAHLDFIRTICNEHPKVLIFLGLSPCMVTQNNPLDFESRKQMILEKFPNVNVLYIKDIANDDGWSIDLDEKISDIIGPNQSVVLYGSRDSFIELYKGKYPTQELVQEVYISGTEIRRSISKKVKNTPEFRAGVIWAAYNQYPKVYATVDIAVFNEECNKILMARKPKEDKYRFIGGFASPTSISYEADARREVSEEAGIEVSDPQYVGSYFIDDWRYKNEVDKIKTILYACKILYGKPQAGDDVCEVRWFGIKEISNDNIVTNHVVLLEAIKNKIDEIKNTMKG